MNFKNLINPPFSLFLSTGLLLSVATPFFWRQRIEYHLHDTLFVFPFVYVIWAVAIVLVLMWIVCDAARKILLSGFLTWVHVTATILFVLACFTSGLWYQGIDNPASRSAYYSFQTMMENNRRVAIIILPLLLMLLLGQLAFIINIVGGIIKYIVNYSGGRNKTKDGVNL
jgi:hypothetical protein